MSEQYLTVHQTRSWPPSAYEMKLAGAIEEIFGSGHHDLDALVAGLNAAGIAAPDGVPWVADRFVDQFGALGG